MKTKLYITEEGFAKDWTEGEFIVVPLPHAPEIAVEFIGNPVQKHEIEDGEKRVRGFVSTILRERILSPSHKIVLQLVYQRRNNWTGQLIEPIVLQTQTVDPERDDMILVLDALWADTLDYVHDHDALKADAGLDAL